MPSRRNKNGLWKLVLAIWLAALMQSIAQPVRAEVRVSGQANAVIVETREASVQEVLAALRASFNLQYRTSGAVNRVITGTYTGSLQRVVARLLEGHNYVMRSSANGGELIVFGPGAAGRIVSTLGRSVVTDARQPDLSAPTPSSDVQGWDGTAPVGPRTVPIPKSAAESVPRVSPAAASAPTPPLTSSAAARINAAAAPASAPPRPESDLQTQPSDIQGWGG